MMPNTLLKLFRLYANLDNVIKDAKTYLDKILLLNDWAHHQIMLWNYGSPTKNIYSPLYQLLAIKHGLIKGWCGNYAILLVSACKSLKIKARHVSIWKKGSYGTNMHNVVEVWRIYKKKWVCLDPYYNIYFRDSSFDLLSVEEISRFVRNGEKEKISITHPMFASLLNPSRFKNDYLEYYFGYKT